MYPTLLLFTGNEIISYVFVLYMQVKQYFATLDDELNKVNQFYRTKESEFLERGEILNKQLQILLDLKQVLSDRRRKNLSSKSGSSFFSRSHSSSARNSDYSGESFFLTLSKIPSYKMYYYVIVFCPLIGLVVT